MSINESNESLPFYMADERMTEPHFEAGKPHTAKHNKKLVILITKGIESEPGSKLSKHLNIGQLQ